MSQHCRAKAASPGPTAQTHANPCHSGNPTDRPSGLELDRLVAEQEARLAILKTLVELDRATRSKVVGWILSEVDRIVSIP